MAEIYLFLLLALLAAVLLRALASPALFFEYPYFSAAVFAVFIVPQAISLIRFPLLASPDAVEAVFLMTLLCAAAGILGYRANPNRWIVERCRVPIDEARMFQVGIVFILCQFVFNYLISRTTVAERGGSMWTGRVTIYLFFANLGYSGFAICLARALAKGDAVAWFWTVIGSVTPIVAGLFYGRRENTVLFGLTVALTLYYQRRYVFPRAVIGGALVAAMLIIPATTQYRMATTARGLSGIKSVDFIGNFQRYLTEPSELELRNAAMMIEATTHTGVYDFGRAYWDQLVFRFVPAQIVGKGVKDMLMFKSSDDWMRQEFASKGYKVVVGSTVTGMGDAFVEFGYFGALFFAALAIIFKSLWQASLDQDGTFAQLLYIQISTSGMRAITHQTTDFLPGLVYNLVFLGMAAYYSRIRQPQSGKIKPVSALR